MTDSPAAAPDLETSRLSRKWTLKMVITAVLLLGLGLWGLYDATVRYPQRGSDAAEYLEYQYLQQLATDHRDYPKLDDPAAELAKLEKRDKEGPTLSTSERALMDWLEQLQIIGKLDAANTKIPRTDFRKELGNGVPVNDTGQRLAYLKQRWTSGAPRASAPLSRYDILMQWLITVAGAGFGLYLVFLLVTARTRVYRWEPVRQELTLPGGGSLLPEHIAEFDKRKWHKLFITLRVKPDHPQLSGKAVEIDLLRYEPVEDWVLAMERTAFPENAQPVSENAGADLTPSTAADSADAGRGGEAGNAH
jgi:hypothetical protein